VIWLSAKTVIEFEVDGIYFEPKPGHFRVQELFEEQTNALFSVLHARTNSQERAYNVPEQDRVILAPSLNLIDKLIQLRKGKGWAVGILSFYQYVRHWVTITYKGNDVPIVGYFFIIRNEFWVYDERYEYVVHLPARQDDLNRRGYRVEETPKERGGMLVKGRLMEENEEEGRLGNGRLENEESEGKGEYVMVKMDGKSA
jgi:hypothetical protein